ncbi:hypothetical protein MRX96_049216 [Rhipicephalus microplus]
MPGCCAYGCRNRTTDRKKFFSIPRGGDNISRRRIWLHRIGRKDFVPTENTRLCEDHFDVEELEPLILQSWPEETEAVCHAEHLYSSAETKRAEAALQANEGFSNYKTSTFS